jgi:hypothetical protein
MFDGECAMVNVGLSDAQDITETLKAIKTAQQLAEDYEQIFANAAIPIVQIDLEGKVRHVFGHVFGGPRTGACIRGARIASYTKLTHVFGGPRIRQSCAILLCCRVR